MRVQEGLTTCTLHELQTGAMVGVEPSRSTAQQSEACNACCSCVVKLCPYEQQHMNYSIDNKQNLSHFDMCVQECHRHAHMQRPTAPRSEPAAAACSNSTCGTPYARTIPHSWMQQHACAPLLTAQPDAVRSTAQDSSLAGWAPSPSPSQRLGRALKLNTPVGAVVE